jgi:hypothetical protein
MLTAEMPGLVTDLSDPVLGAMAPAAGVAPDGSLLEDRSGTIEPVPVVMFEPEHAFVVKDGIGGASEIRTDAIVAAGFRRILPGPAWMIAPADGWEVRRAAGRLILRDSAGEVWASSEITPGPQWMSAAASQRYVAVFFGPKLGVRVPPGTDPAGYTTAIRAAEIREARRYGLVAAAMVRWRSEPVTETLDWLTFEPGSLGQLFPGVFVPAADFARLGGPQTFGLTRLRGLQDGIAADPLRTLVARVSRTDIDLVDPAQSAPEEWVCGVHYPAGIRPAWYRAARATGRMLVLTGPSAPGWPHPDSPGAALNFDDLWAAVVAVAFC